jgi:hypothetical protein
VGVNDLELGNLKLGDLPTLYHQLKAEYIALQQHLANAVVLDKDTEYIVIIDNDIKRIKGRNIVPNEKLKLADHLYEYVDGEIKLKKGVLL